MGDAISSVKGGVTQASSVQVASSVRYKKFLEVDMRRHL